MTNKELDAIYERVNKASTGPWTVEANGYSGKNWLIGTVCVWLGASCQDDKYYSVTTDSVHASDLAGDARTDADFIAHARTDIPALLAEVNRLRNELQAALGDVYRLEEELSEEAQP